LHGHFYQPPRENPWLEAVEVQDSAAPWHDWNERITMECYGPNTAARISTWDGHIIDIRNNFAKISFNFGPTLLQWMEEAHPAVYEEILEADRLSVRTRNGHGNALAQAYNHLIMPLATERERLVQTVWGMEDFRERFGRDPEGMWLPECAVDLKTLDCLASNGIRFTVLAPRQARRFRLLDGSAGWGDCDGGRIDPTRPYLCTLPSGRSIVLFFYDGPISQAVAFEGLLHDGNTFANRLMQGFSNNRQWPELLSVATDGESYGHHHRHGEMALVYALHAIEESGLATLTNYGEYLSRFTPTAEVQIWNNSSWSCVHGVERWRSDCGCNSGMHGGWHQKWRGPLREAFRMIALKADEVFDREAPRHYADPMAALLDYVHVVLDPGADTAREFLHRHLRPDAPADTTIEQLRLMEMMRNAQLMFTSCGWFFDEVSGIETVQNLKYAARLLQLLRPHAANLEARFVQALERAPSNLAELGSAAEAWRRYVRPNIIDLQRVIAHHGLMSFDQGTEGFHRLFCYEIHERETVLRSFNGWHLKLCRLSARSLVDWESQECTVIVLHFGGHDFRCSIMGPLGYSAYEQVKEELLEKFERRSLTELVRAVDERFGRSYFGLEHVFSEGRRELLQRITLEAFTRFDNALRQIYEENRKFMEYLIEAGAPLPQGFLSAAEFVLKTRLLSELDLFIETGDAHRLQNTAREAARFRIRLTDPMVLHRLDLAVETLFRELALAPSAPRCRTAMMLLDVLAKLEIHLDSWEPQNIVFALLHGRPLPAYLERRAVEREDDLVESLPELRELAEKLRVGLEQVVRTSSALQTQAGQMRPQSTSSIAVRRLRDEDFVPAASEPSPADGHEDNQPTQSHH
jgi:alpha-amylase/alpha-mannosidase (GH57 family)